MAMSRNFRIFVYNKLVQMVRIVKINYFPELNGGDYNGKVLYTSSTGRLYHAHIDICFFWRTIRIAKRQPKEAKVLPTLCRALSESDYFQI